MKGRKPVPTHLKLVHGNPGKRRLNRNEPRPVGDLLAAPDWMGEAQAAGWAYAIASAPPGLLRRLDRAVLAAFVVAEQLHGQAIAGVARTGLLTQGSMGQPVPNPLLKIATLQALVMVRCASELGFTPASRSRINAPVGGAPGPDGRGSDEFEEFLNS